MEKVFTFNAFGQDHNIVLRKTTYRNNKTLAVFMVEIQDDGFEEQYGVLTVNLDESDWLCSSGDCQFIDTNNFGWDILDWLEENGIANRTGTYGHSGFCDYPLVIFTEEALASMRSL